MSQINSNPPSISITLVKCETLNVNKYIQKIRCETIYGICDIPLIFKDDNCEAYIPKKFHEISDADNVVKFIKCIINMIYNQFDIDSEFTITFFIEDVGINNMLMWERAVKRWNATSKI
jgi:hypothetical protein